MIKRIWRGWTLPENADRYEHLLQKEILPSILARGIAGLGAIDLLRLDGHSEVEFMTIMTFDGMEAVRGFAGKECHRPYVPSSARAVLARFDETVQHFSVRPVPDAG